MSRLRAANSGVGRVKTSAAQEDLIRSVLGGSGSSSKGPAPPKVGERPAVCGS
jgi:hypothetical protein